MTIKKKKKKKTNTKVPFKESPFTLPPYLQRLRAAQTRPSVI